MNDSTSRSKLALSLVNQAGPYSEVQRGVGRKMHQLQVCLLGHVMCVPGYKSPRQEASCVKCDSWHITSVTVDFWHPSMRHEAHRLLETCERRELPVAAMLLQEGEKVHPRPHQAGSVIALFWSCTALEKLSHFDVAIVFLRILLDNCSKYDPGSV